MVTKQQGTKTSTKSTTKIKQVVNKTIDKKTPIKKQTKQDKPKFDIDAFVFEVDISKIEEWVNGMCIELDDPEFEWPSYDEERVLMVMLNELDFCKNNNIKTILTSARENAIMGLYRR